MLPWRTIASASRCRKRTGGAGEGFETVFGLILGTGCGAGVCYRGQLVTGRNGLHMNFEVSHRETILTRALDGRALADQHWQAPGRHCRC